MLLHRLVTMKCKTIEHHVSASPTFSSPLENKRKHFPFSVELFHTSLILTSQGTWLMNPTYTVLFLDELKNMAHEKAEIGIMFTHWKLRITGMASAIKFFSSF